MEALYTYLKEHGVVYITRERERALGLPANTKGYNIISDKSKSTREILAQLSVQMMIKDLGGKCLVFKNTPSIERIANDAGITLLNPSALLAQEVESKVSQVEWLDKLANLLPPNTWTGKLGDVKWQGNKYGKRFVLQFNIGHSGEGTHLIESEEQLHILQMQFPNRLVRTSAYIAGDTFTNNNVVVGEQVLTGNISYQITGDTKLTMNQFATVGNDWGLAREMLAESDIKNYMNIALSVGNKLKESGWRGAFGIDVIREHATGKMYLIEINARQSASVCFESRIQRSDLRNPSRSDLGARWLTIFEAHLSALLELDINNCEIIAITEGKRTINRLANDNAS